MDIVNRIACQIYADIKVTGLIPDQYVVTNEEMAQLWASDALQIRDNGETYFKHVRIIAEGRKA